MTGKTDIKDITNEFIDEIKALILETNDSIADKLDIICKKHNHKVDSTYFGFLAQLSGFGLYTLASQQDVTPVKLLGYFLTKVEESMQIAKEMLVIGDEKNVH